MTQSTEVLSMRWSKREQDFIFRYPSRKADGALLHTILNCERPPTSLDVLRLGMAAPFQKSLVEELTERGYDITTLRFTIKRASK